jgi:glycosyltransferase involved in cell wall biosynthesis
MMKAGGSGRQSWYDQAVHYGLAETLIVMPAFNEAQTIAAVVAEVKAQLPEAGCLVVNDGSRDSTSTVARSAGAVVLDLPFNLGVGGAMRLGFKYALVNGYSNVIQVDADGQHDPSCVPRLLGALGEADVVIGARFAGEGAYSASGPRLWAMKFFAAAIGRIANTRLTDATSGF